jgi:hypothetical protein
MNDKKLITKSQKLLSEVNKPYGKWNYAEVNQLKSEVEAWLIHPDNDCLRARGDKRYSELSSIHIQLMLALQPY